jgi:hypothetical protein
MAEISQKPNIEIDPSDPEAIQKVILGMTPEKRAEFLAGFKPKETEEIETMVVEKPKLLIPDTGGSLPKGAKRDAKEVLSTAKVLTSQDLARAVQDNPEAQKALLTAMLQTDEEVGNWRKFNEDVLNAPQRNKNPELN